jgi:hypothetical protein
VPEYACFFSGGILEADWLIWGKTEVEFTGILKKNSSGLLLPSPDQRNIRLG